MEKLEKKIETIFEEATADVYDVYYTLFTECLKGQENTGALLEKICREAITREFEEHKNGLKIEEKDIKETKRYYYRLLKESVNTLIRQNLDVKEFYEKLYEAVFQSCIFPKDEKIQSILLCFLAEEVSGLPYFQAKNLLEMTTEEYKEVVDRLTPQINQAIDVLNRHFKSRTEEASQIYEILSQIEDREEKIVFLSVYTNIIQNNSQKRE